MNLLGDALKRRIEDIAKEAERRTRSAVRFEEFIALPHFGQIILRFSLDQAKITLEDLERYESLLYEIVGDEFLVDFMGSVYETVGVDLSAMQDRFAELGARFGDEPYAPSIHSEGIREDARELLERAGMDQSEKVWEIQLDDGQLLLLTMGREQCPIRDLGGEPRLFVGQIREEDGTGLFRAALYAKRNRISLARLLMENGMKPYYR